MLSSFSGKMAKKTDYDAMKEKLKEFLTSYTTSGEDGREGRILLNNVRIHIPLHRIM